MVQYATGGAPLYDLGIGIDGTTRKSPRLSRTDCAALLTDGALGVSVAVNEGDTLTAGGHRYVVCATNAKDHHLTTAGGMKFQALPRDGALSLEALGAGHPQ